MKRQRDNVDDDDSSLSEQSKPPPRRRARRASVSSGEDETYKPQSSQDALASSTTCWNLRTRASQNNTEKVDQTKKANAQGCENNGTQASTRIEVRKKQRAWRDEMPQSIYVAAYHNDTLTPKASHLREAMGVHAFEWDIFLQRPTLDKAKGTRYRLKTDWHAVEDSVVGHFPKGLTWEYHKETGVVRDDLMVGMLKIGVLHGPDNSLNGQDEVEEICSRVVATRDDTTYTWTMDVVLRMWQGHLIWTDRPIQESDLEGSAWFEDLLAIEVQEWWSAWNATRASARRKGNPSIRECLSGRIC